MTERERRVKVLVLATKPPFPPVGGGNMALDALLRALPECGVDARVLALTSSQEPTEPATYPVRCVPASPRRRWLSMLLRGGLLPMPVARYQVPALSAVLAEELRVFAPDVIHLEQPHLGWLLPEIRGNYPVMLREQNVESQVLACLAAVRRGVMARLLRREARRMALFEAQVCRHVDVVAAISDADARRLAELAPTASVATLPAAWGRPPAPSSGRLAGERPILCLGVFTWQPNRDGARWLLRDVWPRLAGLEPRAVLHLAGPGSDRLGAGADRRIIPHGRVPDVAVLYDPRAVAVIPLRAGSGVRLRLLEAWWAGVPAAVTPAAGEGLVSRDLDGACIGDSADEFAAVAVRLARDAELRERVVARGRDRLAAHDAGRVALQARDLYLQAIDRSASRLRSLPRSPTANARASLPGSP
jgi:polysaccharide biosynthesis protein PslH